MGTVKAMSLLADIEYHVGKSLYKLMITQFPNTCARRQNNKIIMQRTNSTQIMRGTFMYP